MMSDQVTLRSDTVQTAIKKLFSSLYRVAVSRSLHCDSVNRHELLLVIYVQGNNILRKSCIHKNILP